MDNSLESITETLSSLGSSALGHALIGLAILIIGLFVVKILVGVFSRMLKKVSVLQRETDDGGVVDLTVPISSLIKAVLTIFVLMAVLQHFGLTDVPGTIAGYGAEIHLGCTAYDRRRRDRLRWLDNRENGIGVGRYCSL